MLQQIFFHAHHRFRVITCDELRLLVKNNNLLYITIMTKKSWIEKRDCSKSPQVKVLDKDFAGMKKGIKMLISSPQDVDAFIRSLPSEKNITPAEMRVMLAKKHNADVTCPVSTGIFIRIVAEAALEEIQAGKKRSEVTPFWKVVTASSPTAKKMGITPGFLAQIRRVPLAGGRGV